MRYIGIDQYGQSYKLYSDFPRKELMEILCYKRAQKMYCDTKNGSMHTGYVIGGLWIRLYKVTCIAEVRQCA